MRALYLAGLVLALEGLAGCTGFVAKTTVYGASGKQYLAPDLCGALVLCRQAKETQCLYTVTTVTTPDGKSTETESCKATP